MCTTTLSELLYVLGMVLVSSQSLKALVKNVMKVYVKYAIFHLIIRSDKKKYNNMEKIIHQ